MTTRSIRLELALLAGIPVLAAVLLSLAIVNDAYRELRKAESLGSVESVAELSAVMSSVVSSLQRERAVVARSLGEGARLEAPPPPPDAWSREAEQTNRALAQLEGFLRGRDLSRLPPRLRVHLQGAKAQLASIEQQRARWAPNQDLLEVLAFYDTATRELIGATAALTELSDDGDLLRVITSLVAVLELGERASEEHSLVVHVLARGEYPPGSYRRLVTVITEQQTYDAVFRTTASTGELELFTRTIDAQLVAETQHMRDAALAATDDELTVDPKRWDDAQRRRVEQIAAVAIELNARVRAVAVEKRSATQQLLWVSASFTGLVLVLSAALAFVIARGLSRSVTTLRDATARVAQGELDVRVEVQNPRELAQLGTAFNTMIAELGRAREALEDQARMSRELEIAASIQTALLPPAPSHADFEFAGRMLPADEVGGDFYDVLTGRGDRLWVTVGDVSSHGLSAGLVMLMAQAAFSTQYHSNPDAPADRVLREVNRVLQTNIADRLHENKYLTAQLLAYRGDGRFSCAGAHEWPIVYRARTGKSELIPTPGPWLGILPDLGEVPLLEITLEPGDLLCLYSDGLTEARNEAGELFDVPRLAQLLEAQGASPALESIVQGVFDAVAAHAVSRDDDWSLLLVRRRPV